jgi:predicted HicB family RNase H-like nuclease
MTTTKIQGTLTLGPHQGYTGQATYDVEAKAFHGEVIGLRDVVTFSGTTPGQVAKAFTDSVDDYLAFCQQRGEDPEKPYSGNFVTRLEPALHRQLTEAAMLSGQSLNSYVVSVLRDSVSTKLYGTPGASTKGHRLRKRAVQKKKAHKAS